MQCNLDRPAVAEAAGAPGPNGRWQIDLDLDDRHADELACIRCGGMSGGCPEFRGISVTADGSFRPHSDRSWGV